MSKILVLLGSESDLPFTDKGQALLKDFRIPFELRIASAHRSSEFVQELVRAFEKQGGKVVVCVAGMSAHLAGAVAAFTYLPVVTVPIANAATAGFDALLSMSQMPAGIPVATMTFGKAGFTNAAIFALQVISLNDPALAEEIKRFRAQQTSAVIESDARNRVMFEG